MRGAVVAVACLAIIAASAVNAAEVRADAAGGLVPTGKGWGERRQPQPGSVAEGLRQGGQPRTTSRTGAGNGIDYNGGPVILGTTNVYYIWYGNWSGNTAGKILEDLAQNIGGSPYFNINTTYYDASGQHVANSVHFGGSATDNYSQGKSLSDYGVQAVVANALAKQNVPHDSNGVYFVLTSSDVNETSGFCTQYCGWHARARIAGLDVKYAFVGNPDRCPTACEPQSTGPNGNAGADGMASIVSHELEESITDPDFNAWFDRRGQENADKCAWTYGSISRASNGAAYNMTLGPRPFLIQQNWVNASGGYCAKAL